MSNWTSGSFYPYLLFLGLCVAILGPAILLRWLHGRSCQNLDLRDYGPFREDEVLSQDTNLISTLSEGVSDAPISSTERSSLLLPDEFFGATPRQIAYVDKSGWLLQPRIAQFLALLCYPLVWFYSDIVAYTLTHRRYDPLDLQLSLPIQFGIFFLAVACVEVWIWGRAWPYRCLAKYGSVSRLVITDKYLRRFIRGGCDYYFDYTFQVPQGYGVEKVSATLRVNEGQFKKAAKGNMVSVLYDQKMPRRSVIYRFCPYQCVNSPHSKTNWTEP